MLAAAREPLHTVYLRPWRPEPTPRPNLPLRIACLLAALPIGALLDIGSSLNPDGGPLAVRQKLCTGRCGFYTKFSFHCRTCGWTSSISHLYNGQIFSASAAQPAGALFGALLAMLFSLLTAGARTGRWLGPSPCALLPRRRMAGGPVAAEVPLGGSSPAGRLLWPAPEVSIHVPAKRMVGRDLEIARQKKPMADHRPGRRHSRRAAFGKRGDGHR